MKLLLDTHAFLWFIENSLQMSADAKRLTEDASTDVFVSAASLWEFAIKIGLGKLKLGQSFETFIPDQLRLNQIDVLGNRLRMSRPSSACRSIIVIPLTGYSLRNR